MAEGLVKLILKVELTKSYDVLFTVKFVHKVIHNANYVILYTNQRDGFVIEKDLLLKYKSNRLTIPAYVSEDISKTQLYSSLAIFSNDSLRYSALKKLGKDLIEFSLSNLFTESGEFDRGYSRILYHENYWFLY